MAATRFGETVRSLVLWAVGGVASSPTLTAGAGAASATEPDGSLRLRTDGAPEYRISSAWQAFALLASAIAATSTITTTDGVASGTARRVGGVAYRNVAASTPITGATETEAVFDQKYSLPANSLKAGTVVRIRAQGIHTATSGAETHTIMVKIGSTTIVSKAAVDPANNDLFYFDVVLQCRTDGATGTVVATGLAAVGASGTATPTIFALASSVVDTTGALEIGVAIDRQAAATDADSARLDVLIVEVIG